MSEIKALDKLRESLKDCIKKVGMEPDKLDTYWITADACDHLIDEIEAEVERYYMRLPVDADGEPIHMGDKVEWLEGNGIYNVCGVGKLVVLRTHESYCFTIDSKCLRIVKPRTLEDVLREYGKAYHAHMADNYMNYNGTDEQVIGKYADEIRELLGGDAE